MDAQQPDYLLHQNAQSHGDVEALADGHVDGSQGLQLLHVLFRLRVQPAVFEHQGSPFREGRHQSFIVRAEGLPFRTLDVNDSDHIVPNLQWNSQLRLGSFPIRYIIRPGMNVAYIERCPRTDCLWHQALPIQR